MPLHCIQERRIGDIGNVNHTTLIKIQFDFVVFIDMLALHQSTIHREHDDDSPSVVGKSEDEGHLFPP